MHDALADTETSREKCRKTKRKLSNEQARFERNAIEKIDKLKRGVVIIARVE